MTIVITLGLHMGCIGGFFTAKIFGNFYTKRGGGFLTFRTGIPGGLAVTVAQHVRMLSEVGKIS